MENLKIKNYDLFAEFAIKKAFSHKYSFTVVYFLDDSQTLR